MRNLSLRHIETMQAIAEAGSLVQAASALNTRATSAGAFAFRNSSRSSPVLRVPIMGPSLTRACPLRRLVFREYEYLRTKEN